MEKLHRQSERILKIFQSCSFLNFNKKTNSLSSMHCKMLVELFLCQCFWHSFYEAFIFLSWSLTFILLILEIFFQNFLIGAMIAPTALFLNAFANFQLPESLQQFSPLVPALKSNWLMMHVTVMLSSYATLMCGCIFSIAFLFLSFTEQTQLGEHHMPDSDASSDQSQTQVLGTYEYMFQSKQKMLLNQFDQISFRAIGIGFPLLTLGILSGSVWANEAWGSYWSWDPKETWSLITWLIFAVYLHLRLTQKWRGFQSAVLATFGFVILWICFLGVNFVAKGLHSYGWLESVS